MNDKLVGMTYDPNNANIKSLQRIRGPDWKKHLASQRGIEESAIQEKSAMMSTIQKLAGSPQPDTGLAARIVDDLVKGAQANPRLGNVQHYTEQAEVKLASAGITPLDVAHMAGTLKALDEAGFSKKEAAEYLNVPEAVIDDVLKVIES